MLDLCKNDLSFGKPVTKTLISTQDYSWCYGKLEQIKNMYHTSVDLNKGVIERELLPLLLFRTTTLEKSVATLDNKIIYIAIFTNDKLRKIHTNLKSF